MGADTKIQWCAYRNTAGVLVPGYTMNFWIGCSHAILSDGTEDPLCTNCYAEAGTMARVQRHRGLPIWGQDAARHRTAPAYWRQPFKWDREAKAAGVRPRVFCESLSDIFEDRRDLDPLREELFPIIEACDGLDWMLLTKRADRAADLAPMRWRGGWPKHVWFGYSAGTPQGLAERWEHAREIPAWVKFCSAEPLLKPIVFGDAIRYLDMIIGGGESGRRARIFDLAHWRSIYEECRFAGVKPFFKQAGVTCIDSDWNGLKPFDLKDAKGGNLDELRSVCAVRGDECLVREWPESRL